MRNLLIKLKNSIVDRFRRRGIIVTAMQNGCDLDGDIVYYKGVYYVVNIRIGIIYRSIRNEKED